MAEPRIPPPRILVAAADAGGRAALGRLLRAEPARYEVVEATSGPQALRLLTGGAADAALVDMHLPGLDGLAILQQARGAARAVPVIALGCPGSVREAVQAMQQGANHYLSRPFSPQELSEALRAALRARLPTCQPASLPQAGSLAEGAGSKPSQRVGDGKPPQAGDSERAPEELQAHKLEVVGRLASGMAHDFNNLLTVVTGYAELLRSALAASSPLRPCVEEILRAVQRGSGVTRQLLAFSRKQVLLPLVLDLNQIVARLEGLLRPLIGENVELILDLADRPCLVRLDPSQAEQVVLNLAVNARDAMPGGGRLCLRTEEGVLAGADGEVRHWVTLAVSDTGCGMDEATQAHLFEPFFTTKGPGQRTGLGLATVQGIVAQAGGHIEVESAPDRGTTFTLLLPPVSELPTPIGQPACTDLPRGCETVLVVEDDDAVRTLVRRILELQCYQVLEAGNGAEAQALAGGHPGPIHLLLTDVIMSGLTGYELARQLRQVRRELRVLYITGYPHSASVQEALTEHGAELLPKPFTAGTLACKVREILDRG